MATMRTYGDGCGIAHALDLVGERWALLVVRELLLGPKRFTDLRDGLPNASPNVLAQRLRELEQARDRPAPQAAAARGLLDLRADRLGPRAQADRDLARHLGHPLAVLPARRARRHRLRDPRPRARSSTPTPPTTSTPATSSAWARTRSTSAIADRRIDVDRGAADGPGRDHRDRPRDAQRADLERPRTRRRAARRRRHDRRRPRRRDPLPRAVPPARPRGVAPARRRISPHDGRDALLGDEADAASAQLAAYAAAGPTSS